MDIHLLKCRNTNKKTMAGFQKELAITFSNTCKTLDSDTLIFTIILFSTKAPFEV